MNKTAIFALLTLSGTASAQVDTSNWLCESCPFEDGYRATTDVGATNVSDDAARFGNATGYDKKGVYANLDGRGAWASDGYRLDWYAEDLGLASRVFRLEAGKPGSFGVTLAYRELPYRRFDTTRTIFSGSGDSLTLPPGWVRAGTTGNMTALSGSLAGRSIESDRRILDLGAAWSPFDQFDLYADFRRQNRDGIKITGGSSFTQASLLPRFFDYETDQIDGGVRYSGERGYLGLAYYGSFFTNRHPSLTWETPFLTAPGAENLRKATAPDNDFQQVSLSGAWRAAPWNTLVAFSLANGRGEQNEAFLPYTINPNVVASALPRASLNGEVDTSNYALTVTARPFEKARLRFTYRNDKRDNKTPVDTWNRVIVDVFDSGDTEVNVPYSFDRTRIGVNGDIAVWWGIRISGGYVRKELERDFQEVAKQTTDAGWGQVRWKPLDWLDLRFRGGTAERDIDRYDETIAQSIGQNPLLRKYHLAYRFRSYGDLTASISPVESRWSMSLRAMLADDRYNKSQLGMTDSEELRVTADFSVAFSDSLSAYLVAGHEAIDALQGGSEQFSTWDWSAHHDDRFDHVGLGATWRDPDDKYEFGFDFGHGRGTTDILVQSLSGGDSLLPQLESTLDTIRVTGRYRFTERMSGTLNLRFESFAVKDWALVAPDTIPTVLTLGAAPYDYDVWALGLGISYSFGSL